MKTSIVSLMGPRHMGQSVNPSSLEHFRQRHRCLHGSNNTVFLSSSQMTQKYSSAGSCVVEPGTSAADTSGGGVGGICVVCDCGCTCVCVEGVSSPRLARAGLAISAAAAEAGLVADATAADVASPPGVAVVHAAAPGTKLEDAGAPFAGAEDRPLPSSCCRRCCCCLPNMARRSFLPPCFLDLAMMESLTRLLVSTTTTAEWSLLPPVAYGEVIAAAVALTMPELVFAPPTAQDCAEMAFSSFGMTFPAAAVDVHAPVLRSNDSPPPPAAPDCLDADADADADADDPADAPPAVLCLR
mmetsp:Transcript_30999/g.92915  ORF Transcript_30999/g.92915 Transcript_30999/m.92915 type:complete len:299 (+) Transcript_30999:514-1410(+)